MAADCSCSLGPAAQGLRPAIQQFTIWGTTIVALPLKNLWPYGGCISSTETRYFSDENFAFFSKPAAGWTVREVPTVIILPHLRRIFPPPSSILPPLRTTQHQVSTGFPFHMYRQFPGRPHRADRSGLDRRSCAPSLFRREDELPWRSPPVRVNHQCFE